MAHGDDIDSRVRRRLKELRQRRGLTLEAVAAGASLDVSTLSRLESGKRRLTLEHLSVLAPALGVSADELLAPPPSEDPRVRSKPRKRDGLTMWSLTRIASRSGIQAYKIRIDPARSRPPAELPVHDGHDWIYVLSGRMRLMLGEEDMVVEPGEAVEFSTLTPHWFGAVEEPVELLFLVGPQGERIHLRGA